MLRSIRFATVFRLLAWPLFAAFLAFLAWNLYVILPPKARWVIEDSSLQIPICFLNDGSRAVFMDLGKAQQERFGLTIRDLTNGGELPGSSEGEPLSSEGEPLQAEMRK